MLDVIVLRGSLTSLWQKKRKEKKRKEKKRKGKKRKVLLSFTEPNKHYSVFMETSRKQWLSVLFVSYFQWHMRMSLVSKYLQGLLPLPGLHQILCCWGLLKFTDCQRLCWFCSPRNGRGMVGNQGMQDTSGCIPMCKGIHLFLQLVGKKHHLLSHFK